MQLPFNLGLKREVHVPCGPTRHVNSLNDKNLAHYSSTPDEAGVMQDGNPFYLFWTQADESHERELKPSDTEILICGQTLRLRWFEAVTEVGLLLLVYSSTDAADTNEAQPPIAHAWCFAWNSMCAANGGMLSRHICERFAMPMNMAYPQATKEPEA